RPEGDCTDEVILSRKGANSPTRGRKLRSTGTRAKARVSNGPNSLIELEKQLEARTRELAEARGHLSEALEQQVATSEVLRVISSWPGELEPVFQAMLENATRLCEAESAALGLCEGADLRVVARYNAPTALLQETKRDPIFRPGPASGVGRSIRLKQVVQVPDIANDQAYFDREPARVRLVEAGYRSQLSVPLIKNNEAIGAFNMFRQKTGLFTEEQIELVKSFAEQAVIAIENTRLLNELRQRTDDLSESLEQQTATAEELEVISSSPGELEPVFEALLANAKQLCGAKFGTFISAKETRFARWPCMAQRPNTPRPDGTRH